MPSFHSSPVNSRSAILSSNPVGMKKELQKEPGAPTSVWSILVIAATLGLLTGLLEAIGTLLLVRWDRWISVGPAILWIAPVVETTIFLCVAITVFAAVRVVRKIPAVLTTVCVFGFLGFYDLAGFSERISSRAAAILALGLTVQLWRWVNGHEESCLSSCGKALPCLLAIVLVLWLGLMAGGRIGEMRGEARLPPAAPGAPNVLLIVIDTARADHFSSYRYARQTTPHIDQLAREGGLWERAYSTASWTLPSHASIFTGHYPHDHLADGEPLDVTYSTLAEALSARGYRTAGFSANVYNVTRREGLNRGFVHWEDYFGNMADMAVRTYYVKKYHRTVSARLGYFNIFGRKTAAAVNSEFLRWLDRPSDRPFLVFLNYFDAHDPYLSPEAFNGHFSGGRAVGGILNSYFHKQYPLTPGQLQSEVDAYDGGLFYVDQQIGVLREELERRGLAQNTLIIITSDHGESLGEHGLFAHGNSLYYETLHVPLILCMPGHIAAGQRSNRVVSNKDIPATVLDLLGGPKSSIFPGTSLTGTGPGFAEDDNAQVIAEIQQQSFWRKSTPTYHGPMKSLMTGRWQLILHQSGKMELYDLAADPQQLHDQANTEEGNPVAEALRKMLLEQSSGPWIYPGRH